MQYEIIATVRLLIIAEILGLIAAELLPGRVAAFCIQMRRQPLVQHVAYAQRQQRDVPTLGDCGWLPRRR